ncbi:tetratricopeptide repeat protein [Pseudodesulfovibrio sp. zrk46]|uniref:tetratricopeptide repeat protein n=1 Tax=Pseudodesulfovibrio sp. zrk46 TaxID=2725288 RepID=UPI001449A4FC|nr:tetratricopeptide repeat protein [Pseudodesulfovibrio sp. zrk46]QJB57320.1 tetratricopeptide repeat protein [Pseudodesulfovibrio sp. zrk46]
MVKRQRTRNSKSLYVIKSCQTELKDLEAKKKSETKSLYVVRTDDEVTHKYGDVVYDFVDQPGVFILITRDKNFYQTFKNAIVHDLRIESEYVQVVSSLTRASELVQYFHDKKVTPCIFMEHSIDGELTLSYLRFIRASFKNIKLAVLSRELSRDRLFQFFEDGADSFLKKPSSVNAIITKIAFMLKPQREADALVEEGREHIRRNRFEEALAVSEKVLSRWPKNAAAMVVYGDAKKGLAKRQEALHAYEKAERNSKNFLEPLQRIVMMHAEDDNKPEALKYLTKLDRLSPLNCNRKIKIAELYFDQGDSLTAEKYFDNAISSAKQEALAVVGEMSIDIAEMAAKHDPKMAAKYYRQSLDFIKSSKSGLAMTIYNRLGISLRKQGLWKEAIEAYAEAARHSPKDENIQYNMALAYAEGEHFKDSAQRLLTALSINPEIYKGRAAMALRMGEIFVKGDKKKEALRCLAHCRSLDPNYPGCSELLRQAGYDGNTENISA